MIRVALCDDDELFLDKLEKLVTEALTEHQCEAKIYKYTDGIAMIDAHKEKAFDAIFLDIDMPSISGFDVAKEFAQIDNNCQVIFVTSHSELIYDSFLFRPLNFITKTDEQSFKKRLRTVIQQLLEQLKQEMTITLEDKNDGRIVVHLRDVIYIASNNHHVSYYLVGRDEPVIVREKISDLEERYADNNFIRVHKKYIVNLAHVFNIDLSREVVIFKQKFSLSMSQTYKEDANNKLTEYLRRSR